MSRGLIACAIGVACISFSLKTRADDVPYYLRPSPPGSSALHDDGRPISPPRAPPFEPVSARFGAKGQFVMTGNTDVGLSYSTYDGSSARFFNATFSPAIDYFVVKNLAIGLRVSASYGDNRGYAADGTVVDTKSSSVLVGPRVSYNVALGRYVSWYPSVSFVAGYAQSSRAPVTGPIITGGALDLSSTSEADAQVNIDASLYFHPRSHVLFGIGPNFTHDFARIQGGPDLGAQTTSLGAGVTVGGYWGGERSGTRHDEPTAPPRRTLRKLGDAHEVVFTNAFVTQGGITTHGSTGLTSGDYEFTLAADYFVAPHVSIGGFVSGSYELSSGVDAQTNSYVKNESDSVGLGFQVGAEIPLVDAISLYPRAALSLNSQHFDDISGSAENDSGVGGFHVALFVPIEVEIAPHFFAGFGPDIGHDLTGQPSATSIGAGAELGVWL